MTHDFEKTLTKRTKSIFDTFFFKKIDEENVEELFDIEKDDLFYNVVTQQFCQSDVRKTYNNERQMKSSFKLLMIKFKELQKKFCDYKNTRSTEIVRLTRHMRDP